MAKNGENEIFHKNPQVVKGIFYKKAGFGTVIFLTAVKKDF